MFQTSRRAWCLLLILSLLSGAACGSREVVVTMTREEIQTHLHRRFPIRKSALVVELILDEPAVVLKDGSDRVGVDMIANVKVLTQTAASGRLSVSGLPRYEPESKSFYLEQPAVEGLELSGLKPEYEPKARAIAEALTREVLVRYPLYELKGRNLKEIGAGFVLRSVRVRHGKLEATLGL